MSTLIPVSDCDVCAFVGPDDTATGAQLRELHRAWHAFVEVFVDAFVGPLDRALYRALDRLMRRWKPRG